MINSEKKFKIFEDFKESIRKQILLCVLLSSIVIVFYIFINKLLDNKTSHEYTITDDVEFMNEIESVNVEDDKIIFSGFAFLLENDSLDSKISVFLRNVINNKEIWLDMEQNKRNDINSYYGSKYNYDMSGFLAKTKKKNLNADECYEIIINIDFFNTNESRERKTVSSNSFIYNKELYDYNPFNYDDPDINLKSDLLREVFSDGRLCFYDKDIGIYVYQYDGKLYWITNEYFQFDKSGSTSIPYHLFTSEIDKLPDNQIQYKYDNLSFRFEEYVYNLEDTTPYLVAVRDIPNGYPITYVKTGVHDREKKEWIWTKLFHLNMIN